MGRASGPDRDVESATVDGSSVEVVDNVDSPLALIEPCAYDHTDLWSSPESDRGDVSGRCQPSPDFRLESDANSTPGEFVMVAMWLLSSIVPT